MDTHFIEQSAATSKPKNDKTIGIGPFAGWAAAGFGPELLPIAPPDTEVLLKDGPKISNGKMPARKGTDGKWYGLRKWTDPKRIAMGNPRVGDEWRANLGLQGRAYPMFDLDIENKEIADGIEKLVRDICGDAPVRRRTDASARRLLLYRGKEAGSYRQITFEDPNGDEHRVEFLGAGRQAVVEGRHKKGGRYIWDEHPCNIGPAGLTEITSEQVDKYAAALSGYLELIGCKIVMGSRSSAAQPRQPLDAPGRAASSPQHVLDALKCKPNDFETHNEFVTAIASIKVGLGKDREDYYPDVEQWAIEGWPDNTPEYVHAVWDSIRESSLGWDWFEGLARAGGYTGAAQEDFKTPVDPKYLPDPPPPAKFSALAPAIIPPGSSLPQREWVYDQHYIRRYLGATIAPGGVGKSKNAIAETLAMVTGKPLLGVPVPKPARVLYWNLEDPEDELLRLFAAATQFHGVTNEDIGGRLFLRSGRKDPLTLAYEDHGTVKLNDEAFKTLQKEITENNIDVVIFDPFVSAHALPENDNGKIDRLCKAISMRVAEPCNCAIELVHHSRKFSGSQKEASVDDARGASALINAVRSARVLNVMSKGEADRATVDNHYAYFRIDNGKATHAPRSDKSTWRRFINMQLGNGNPIPHAGDGVGVVTPWEWPGADGDVTPEEKQAALAAVDNGRWRAKPTAKDWVGHAIATGLALDMVEPQAREKVKGIIEKWKADGTLIEFEGKDKKSRPRPCIKVGRKIKPTANSSPSTPSDLNGQQGLGAG
jgi:AAA domain